MFLVTEFTGTGVNVIIGEVGAVLISILVIAWRGGAMTAQLRTEQKEMQKIIAETKARVETIQSVEMERMKGQIQTLQTALAVVQAAGGIVPGAGVP